LDRGEAWGGEYLEGERRAGKWWGEPGFKGGTARLSGRQPETKGGKDGCEVVSKIPT